MDEYTVTPFILLVSAKSTLITPNINAGWAGRNWNFPTNHSVTHVVKKYLCETLRTNG